MYSGPKKPVRRLVLWGSVNFTKNFFIASVIIMCLCGVVVSMHSYKFAGLVLHSGLGIQSSGRVMSAKGRGAIREIMNE